MSTSHIVTLGNRLESDNDSPSINLKLQTIALRHYRPPTKLQEVHVFSRVRRSVCSGGPHVSTYGPVQTSSLGDSFPKPWPSPHTNICQQASGWHYILVLFKFSRDIYLCHYFSFVEMVLESVNLSKVILQGIL